MMDELPDWIKADERKTPAWAPIGRGGKLVQLPPLPRTYSLVDVLSVFGMGVIVGAVTLLCVMAR